MTPVFVNGRFLGQRVTGVQRYARGLLRALDERLQDHPPAAPWTLLLPPGVTPPPLRAIGVRSVGWAGPGGGHGWEQWALPRAARGGLLLSLAGAAPAFAAHQACVLHDAAVFDHPQAYSLTFRTWYRWLFRRLARSAARPLTISAFSRRQLARATGVPEERFALVPGGADHLADVVPAPCALAARGLEAGRYLLAVGSLNPTKNLPALLRAWARLGRSDRRLVLVGAGNAAVFSAPALPAVAGVEMLSAVDDAELLALYRGAAGLVFPSLYEGFGLPPLEAMAAGCPVAAARSAALPEVLGDAPLWFDPRDEGDMATALARLLDDADLAATLRERGAALVAQRGWDRSAAALLAALAVPEARR